MDTISEKEQKSGALTRNTWISLILVIIVGGTYNTLLFAFFGDSISSLNDIPIISTLLSLLFYISFSFGPFILAALLSFFLTRKIKISLIAGIISFVLQWIVIIVIMMIVGLPGLR